MVTVVVDPEFRDILIHVVNAGGLLLLRLWCVLYVDKPTIRTITATN